MSKLRVYNFAGINQKQSPLLLQEGELLWSKNLTSTIRGAKTKRTGYSEIGGTFADDVDSIYAWLNPTTGAKYYYLYADQKLYYSNVLAGTTTWSEITWGTNGGTVGTGQPTWASMGSQIFVSGILHSLYSNNGTSFGTMAGAPTNSIDLLPYKQRLYLASGTTLYASELGSPTGWSLSATNPSFSEPMDGSGLIAGIYTANDEIVIHQAYGQISHFDGFRKYISPSNDGMGYHKSKGNTDGINFYSNNDGVYAFTTQPQKISEAIEPLYKLSDVADDSGPFYNNFGATGVAYNERYLLHAGYITNPSMGNPPTYGRVSGYITFVYDLKYNEWDMWETPEIMHSLYYDGGIYGQGLLMGSEDRMYQFSESVYSDNGQAITAEMVGMLHFKEPERDKKIKRITAHASPGCGATFSIAMSDSLNYENLQWYDIGDLYGGVRKWNAPDLRGKYMYYKLYESSTDKPFTFYGFTVDFDYVGE